MTKFEERSAGPPSSEDDLVHEGKLRKRWRKSPRTLQRWRRSGYGPPYLRIGGSVFYRMADILAFEEAARSRPGESR